MPSDIRLAGLPILAVPTGAGRAPVLVAVRCEAGPDGDAAQILSPGERRLHRAMSPVRAAEFLRGRALLRRLAGTALGVPPEHVPLTRSAGGAPRLAGTPAGVSLSHDGRHTAAAYWPEGPVGVDVQEAPPRLDAALIRRCCGAWATYVDRLPAGRRAAVFARVWSVQEACVKATGRGLSAAPWRIPVDPAASRGRWQDIRWYALDAVPSAALAVAVPVQEPVIARSRTA